MRSPSKKEAPFRLEASKLHSRQRLCWKLMPAKLRLEKSLRSKTAPRVIVRRDPESCVDAAPCNTLKFPPSCSPAIAPDGSSRSADRARVDIIFFMSVPGSSANAIVTAGAFLADTLLSANEGLRVAIPAGLGAKAVSI